MERGALRPGQIRDSNRPMLLAVLAEAGCDAVDYGIAPDDEKTLTATRGAMSTPERADSAPAMAHVTMEVALVLIPDRAAA